MFRVYNWNVEDPVQRQLPAAQYFLGHSDVISYGSLVPTFPTLLLSQDVPVLKIKQSFSGESHYQYIDSSSGKYSSLFLALLFLPQVH